MLRLVVRKYSLNRLHDLPEYAQGLEYAQSNNFAMAELEFERCLLILDSARGDPAYNFVLERLAVMYRVQGKHSRCSKALEDLVHLTKDDLPAFQRASINHLKELTFHNPELAIESFNALNYRLFEEEQLNELKQTAGTAHLLVGKHLDAAKGLLRQANPVSLHNLACAQWWHLLQFAPDSSSEDKEIAKLDAKESVPNFIKAIQLFEQLPEPFAIEQLPKLANPISGLSLTNIAEFCIQSDALEAAVQWLKGAIEFYARVDRPQMTRALTLMAVVLMRSEQYLYAEGLLNTALKNVIGVT
mmetsp:Transcript_11442/g.22448  ORF Transcript_11442/g.22448 Transcript_11442/m.22448 type:complete len:301 (-) Transcript_11442:942-1844(-)